MLGRIPPSELPRELALELAWIIGLLVLNRWTFNRGVRRYCSFGG
jgi:ABC-type uncharacterized transport system permease subunit